MRDKEIPPDGNMGDICTAEYAESRRDSGVPDNGPSANSAVPCSSVVGPNFIECPEGRSENLT